jgi:anti-sigma regulatory factor (Ser/Thr protein kinase)
MSPAHSAAHATPALTTAGSVRSRFEVCGSVQGSPGTSQSVAVHDGFRHEAFFYTGEGDFLAGTAAFIRDAVAAGEPIVVAVDATKIAALRTVLNGDAETVQFADVANLGRNPARTIPAWRTFVDHHSANSRRLRGVSEPKLAGRSQDELVEWRHHEALLNEAFADTTAFWLLCPYDVAAVDPVVIEQAHDTHALIDQAGRRHPSRRYNGDEATALFQEPLGEPPAGVEVHEFGTDDLGSMRHIATRTAVTVGLADRAPDVALVASELATNSVLHGGGRGLLRLWRQHTTLICDVRDRGHVADPLVGRRRPVDGQVGGRGLWVVNQICDLLQVRSSPLGTTVRAHISFDDSPQ